MSIIFGCIAIIVVEVYHGLDSKEMVVLILNSVKSNNKRFMYLGFWNMTRSVKMHHAKLHKKYICITGMRIAQVMRITSIMSIHVEFPSFSMIVAQVYALTSTNHPPIS